MGTARAPATAEEFAPLAAFLDSLPHPAALLDSRGTSVFVNATERTYLGMEGDADLSMAPQEYIHPADFHLFPETIASLLDGTARSVSVELRIRRHDGQYRWHICSASPLSTASGRADGWIVTFVDVEDHRQLATELREARSRADESLALIDTLQASAPIGFALIDRDYRYQRINEALAVSDGMSVADHLGRHVCDVVPDLWDRLEPVFGRVLRGEAVLDVEIAGETPASPGEQRQWLASYFPVQVGENRRVVAIGTIARDVTEERRTAERMTRAQKMEAVGQLAGGIAHDFNNVLATISLTAGMLSAGTTDERMRAGLVRILASVESAAELTNQLLLLARRQPTNPSAVDVADVLARVLDLLSGTIGDAVAVDVDVEGCPAVLIDRTHLEQVMLNLIINACQAMPDGGQLSIRAAPAPGQASGVGPVALTVSDTGVGMAPEVRDRAFEPFFSTKSAGTGNRSGSGLGLSTVHGIVTGAGGQVNIESEVGRGTSIRVDLQRAATEPVDVGATTS